MDQKDEYWGYHAMFDCRDLDLDKISDGVNITSFTKELVKRIDMVAYGEPQVAYFAEHDPNKAGYTMTQMISTSSITGHFVDKDRTAYIDVFSCKPFDMNTVKDVIREYLGTNAKFKEYYLTRQA